MQDQSTSVHSADSSAQPNVTNPAPTRVSPRHLSKLDRALRIAAQEDPAHDPPFGIWLCGESGSGKSTLVRAARTMLQDDELFFVEGEAFPGTSEVLEPILRAARTLFEDLAQSGRPEAEAAWETIARVHAPALSRVLPEVDWGRAIESYPDLDPQRERNRLFDHLAGVFLRASEIAPVVLHLEGAEHLDGLSIEFLHTLAHVVRSRRAARRNGLAVPSCRITVVASTHEEVQSPLRLPEGEVMQMVLRGLGRDEFAMWLEREYDMEIPLSIREKLYQQTRGNPLDLEFRIRQERRRFEDGDPIQRVKRLIDYGAYAIEVGRHVRRLSDAACRALQVLAIAGKPISPKLLSRVGGDPIPEEPTELVAELVAAGWARLHRAGSVSLAHERMQEPILESIGRAECRKLHRAFADVVDAEHADRINRRVREIYHHRVLAEDRGSIVAAGFAAADESLRLYDFEGARQIYRSLLAVLVDADVESLVRGVVALADVLGESASPEPELLDEIERTVNRRKRDIDRETLAGIGRRLGRVAGNWGLTEKEVAFYKQAFEVIRRDDRSLERMKIYACLARTSLDRQRFDDTLQYCERGWEASDANLDQDPDYLELCRVTEEVHFRRGEYVEARSFEERYLNLADQQGSPVEVIESLFRLAYLAEHSGDQVEAEACLRRCLPVAERTGSRLLMARASERLGQLHQRQGLWESAFEFLRDAYHVEREIGTELRRARLLASLGVTCFFVNRENEGASYLRQYADFEAARERGAAEALPDVQGLPSSYRDRSERDNTIRIRQRELLAAREHEAIRLQLELSDLLRDRGELASARSMARRGLREAERLRSNDWTPAFALRLGLLARWNGEVEAALTWFQRGLDELPARAHRDIVAEINVQVGLLQQSRGELTRSRLSLLRGLKQYLDIGHGLGVAHSLVHLAETYLYLGRRDVSEELGLAALTIAQGYHNPRAEAEARLLLGRVRSCSPTRNSGLQDANAARGLFDTLGILEGRCRALLLAGEVGQRWGQINEARAHCHETLEIARDLGLSSLIARALALRGAIEGDRRAGLSELPRAVKTLESALDHAMALRDRHLELLVHGTFARVYHLGHRPAAARTHLERAKEVLLLLAKDSPVECRDSMIDAQALVDLLRAYDAQGKHSKESRVAARG